MNRSLCLLALVALLGITMPVYGTLVPDKRPWFCHGLDCPKYKVVETTDAYEVREYKEAVWATTTVETYNYAMASSIGFKRLFDYIGGSNKDEVKIPMTAPVLADVEPSQGKMASALGDALDADGHEYEDDHYYVAGYDPPFRFKDRHTEIWFKAKTDDDSVISGAIAEE
ncbi:hypothetical protein Ndes2526B_g02030 [Nannochloris sp. 'desiccata']